MIVYSKFNPGRQDKFQLVTTIEKENGIFFSCKKAASEISCEFSQSFLKKFNDLREADFSFSLVEPTIVDSRTMRFPYQKGDSMDALLFDMAQAGDEAAFIGLIKEYAELIRKNGLHDTRPSESFKEIFGGNDDEFEFVNNGCLDLNFDNILIDNGNFFVIDYEWTFSFNVPYKYIVFRALSAFYSVHRSYNINKNFIKLADLYGEFDITRKERDIFIDFEYNFQKFVGGNKFFVPIELYRKNHRDLEFELSETDLAFQLFQQKDQEIVTLNQSLQQKDQEIVALNQSLQQKDQEIVALNQSLQQKDQDVAFMKSSSFWKLRKNYLFIKELLGYKKTVSLMKTAFVVFRRDGGKILVKRIGRFFVEMITSFKGGKEVPKESRRNYLCDTSSVNGLVSVIIPIYDRIIELDESIRSILEQTYKNFELILVTDGSPKETIDVVERYRGNPRVKIFHYFNNTGNAVRGRNKGIKEARGEFIAFQDSDDIADCNRLAISVQAMSEDGADVVYGGWRAKMDGSRVIDGVKNGQEIYSPDCDFEFLKKTCVPCQGTVMVKRSALVDVGGLKPLMKYREDHELWVRLAYNGYKFKSINKILTNLRLHKGNNELNFKGNDQKWEKLMLSEYAKKGELPKKIAYIIPGTGISGGIAVILEHANRLLKRGYDVLLISQDFKETIDWFPDNRVPIISLGTISPYLLKNIDVLIATGWSTVDVLDEIPALRKLYFVQSDERRFDEDVDYKKNVTKTYQRDDVEYFTMAKWIQNWLKIEFGHDVMYVPNGLGQHFLDKAEPFEKKNRKIRVLVEGPISIPFKGVADAMKALRGIDCDIWIVSSSGKPEQDWIYERFFEKVPFADMPKIYSSCDILLKMSKVESFCYPPLEMMACRGVSVIRKVTGIEEYASNGENCLIVNDIAGARKAVQKLVNDAELRMRLADSGHIAARAWSWDRSIDLLEKVIAGE